MQSSLNEGSSLGTIVNAIAKGADAAGIGPHKKDNNYIGGSISRYSKKLIMSFPVLCDNTLSVSTMQLISKANEKNIVSLLQLMFTDMSLSGNSGAEIIAKFHKNIGNKDIDDIIDAIDDFVSESVDHNQERRINAQARDLLKEMVLELKKPAKFFPINSLNEKSLNGYQVRNDRYGNMHVIAVKEADDDKYRKAQNATDMNRHGAQGYDPSNPDYLTSKEYEDLQRDRREEERRTRDEERKDSEEKRKEEKRGEERQKHGKDLAIGALRVNDIENQQMHRQILDSDFKKANELQPTLMQINFNVVNDEGNVVDRRTFLCGVKSRLIGVDGMDIVERLAAKNKTKLSFKNFIKATTGETNLITDFLLAHKQQKLNAKNAAKKGISAQMWNLLEKRSNKNTMNKVRRSGNDATAITTLVVNAETAAYLASAFKFDINNPKNAKFIMDSYNLLGLFIADEANEVVKVMYDGNSQFEMIAYTSLSKDYNDASTYKKTVNLLNQMGR